MAPMNLILLVFDSFCIPDFMGLFYCVSSTAVAASVQMAGLPKISGRGDFKELTVQSVVNPQNDPFELHIQMVNACIC